MPTKKLKKDSFSLQLSQINHSMERQKLLLQLKLSPLSINKLCKLISQIQVSHPDLPTKFNEKTKENKIYRKILQE